MNDATEATQASSRARWRPLSGSRVAGWGLAGIALLALSGGASSVHADILTYNISGDASQLSPGTTYFFPDAVFGTAVIDDDGGGTPTLVDLEVTTEWALVLDGFVATGIPGTTLLVEVEATKTVPGGQTGTGDNTTSIAWGPLTGWSQTGQLTCTSFCGGTPGCPLGVSACIPFVGFEGTGPPAPLKSTSLTLASWSFAGGDWTMATTEFVSLAGGAVQGWETWTGFGPVVPMLPLKALGALGAGLVYLGARVLRRKRD